MGLSVEEFFAALEKSSSVSDRCRFTIPKGLHYANRSSVFHAADDRPMPAVVLSSFVVEESQPIPNTGQRKWIQWDFSCNGDTHRCDSLGAASDRQGFFPYDENWDHYNNFALLLQVFSIICLGSAFVLIAHRLRRHGYREIIGTLVTQARRVANSIKCSQCVPSAVRKQADRLRLERAVAGFRLCLFLSIPVLLYIFHLLRRSSGWTVADREYLSRDFNENLRQIIHDSEVIPILTISMVSLRVVATQDAMMLSTLDRINAGMSLMWVCKLVMMTPGTMYIYNQGWIVAFRVLMGLLCGNAFITTIQHFLVTVVDIYVFYLNSQNPCALSRGHTPDVYEYGQRQAVIFMFAVLLSWCLDLVTVAHAKSSFSADAERQTRERFTSAVMDAAITVQCSEGFIQITSADEQSQDFFGSNVSLIGQSLNRYVASPDEMDEFLADVMENAADTALRRTLHVTNEFSEAFLVKVYGLASPINDEIHLAFSKLDQAKSVRPASSIPLGINSAPVENRSLMSAEFSVSEGYLSNCNDTWRHEFQIGDGENLSRIMPEACMASLKQRARSVLTSGLEQSLEPCAFSRQDGSRLMGIGLLGRHSLTNPDDPDTLRIRILPLSGRPSHTSKPAAPNPDCVLSIPLESQINIGASRAANRVRRALRHSTKAYMSSHCLAGDLEAGNAVDSCAASVALTDDFSLVLSESDQSYCVPTIYGCGSAALAESVLASSCEAASQTEDSTTECRPVRKPPALAEDAHAVANTTGLEQERVRSVHHLDRQYQKLKSEANHVSKQRAELILSIKGADGNKTERAASNDGDGTGSSRSENGLPDTSQATDQPKDGSPSHRVTSLASKSCGTQSSGSSTTEGGNSSSSNTCVTSEGSSSSRYGSSASRSRSPPTAATRNNSDSEASPRKQVSPLKASNRTKAVRRNEFLAFARIHKDEGNGSSVPCDEEERRASTTL